MLVQKSRRDTTNFYDEEFFSDHTVEIESLNNETKELDYDYEKNSQNFQQNLVESLSSIAKKLKLNNFPNFLDKENVKITIKSI